MIYTEQRTWWLEDPEQLAAAVRAAARLIDEETVDRQQRIMDAIGLYGAHSGTRFATAAGALPQDARISHNVVANAVDTLVAEVSQSPPRPMALSVGGSYLDQVRCKRMTQFWDAQFRLNDVHSLALQAIRDGIVCGLGCLRVYAEEARVYYERIHPLSILVDDRHAVDVLPRSLYLRRSMDRQYLVHLYPEHAEAIRGAPTPEFSYWIFDEGVAARMVDLVEVWEAWHLPSGAVAKDGRHAIVIGEAVILDEPWTRESYPLAFVRPVLPVRGFWGEMLVERAKGAQWELNKLLRRLQDAMHLAAVPRIFVQRSAGIVKTHLTNQVGTVVEYDGNPPVFLTPPSMSAEVYAHIDRLTQWIYDEMGVSRLSAESMKPAGINSGRAIRLFREISSRRHINTSRAYEQLYVDLAHESARLERALAEQDPNREVVFERGKLLERIPWREIDLDEDSFRIGVFPASALPTTPGAKLEVLQEMVRDGMLDPKTMLRLADMPDVEAARDLVVAPEELLEQVLDRMLEEGEYTPPEPYMDLAAAKRLSALKVMRAQLHGAPEDRLELLRMFWLEATDLLAQAQAAVAPLPSPPIPPPGGPPGAPPLPPVGHGPAPTPGTPPEPAIGPGMGQEIQLAA